MTPLLLVSSSIALLLLVVHSWRTRGRAVTLTFFIAGTVFGLLRGNAIWLLVQQLSEAPEALTPYIPQGGLLPEIGHASIQVAVGWVFSLYLAWTVSELILRRLPRLAGRVFMVSGLASLFMLAICYCMETTAVTVGWWYWTLPTRSALFGNVPVVGMEGWFSVVPDFLIPFLVIVCAATRGKLLKWLWLLVFPLHIVGHMMYAWFVYAYFIYYGLAVLVVLLMAFGRLRMSRGEMWGSSVLPGAALVIFFSVLAVANVAGGGGAKNLITLLPMMLLCLLGWRRLPVTVVAALSVVAVSGCLVVGPRALWALVPMAAYGFLWLLEHLAEPLWLRLVPTVAAVVLSAASAVAIEMHKDLLRRYVDAWIEADKLAFAGRQGEAGEAYDRADEFRPRDVGLFHVAVRHMMQVRWGDPEQAARLIEHRLPRVLRELEELVRRDPEWSAPRFDLAHFYLLSGRLGDATRQYREMARVQPWNGEILGTFAYLLLREGEVSEAEEVCLQALRLREPPPDAMVNLGVIRLHQGRSEEARELWTRACALQPGHPVALLNLQALEADAFPPGPDIRHLARPSPGEHAAFVAGGLAVYGRAFSPADRVRLLLEATQFDPTYLPAHQNLARVYLEPGPFHDPRRALWHAKRAVEIARAHRSDPELAEGLLLEGRALIASGRPEEARRALEEGKPKAPPAMQTEFDRLLRGLDRRN